MFNYNNENEQILLILLNNTFYVSQHIGIKVCYC